MNVGGWFGVLVSGLLLTAPASADSAQEELRNGKAALAAHNDKEAIAHLTEAIRLDPKNAEAFYVRGKAYDSTFEYDKAFADLDEAIRLDSKFAKAFLLRGQLHYVKSENEKALADLAEAIKLDSKDQEGWGFRAIVRYEMDDYAKAIDDLKEGIRQQPKDPANYYRLANLLATCLEAKYRDGKKAIEYATEACKLTEWKHPAPLTSLAASYAEAGKFDDAVKSEKQAMELFTSHGFSPPSDCENRLKLYEARKPLRCRSIAHLVNDVEMK